ncbi:MAG: phosphatidylglycerophosphatase A family protein [Leptospirillum sp.]
MRGLDQDVPFGDRMLCTLFGVGYSPVAPGTMGSLVTLVLWWAIPVRFLSWEWFAVVALGIAGVLSAGKYSERTGVKDPDMIVVDEFVGQSISLLMTEHDIIHGLTAFIFFRFLDILKPGPIGWAEDLRGGVGIMADDVLAGILAGVLTIVLFQIFPVDHH